MLLGKFLCFTCASHEKLCSVIYISIYFCVILDLKSKIIEILAVKRIVSISLLVIKSILGYVITRGQTLVAWCISFTYSSTPHCTDVVIILLSNLHHIITVQHAGFHSEQVKQI